MVLAKWALQWIIKLNVSLCEKNFRYFKYVNILRFSSRFNSNSKLNAHSNTRGSNYLGKYSQRRRTRVRRVIFLVKSNRNQVIISVRCRCRTIAKQKIRGRARYYLSFSFWIRFVSHKCHGTYFLSVAHFENSSLQGEFPISKYWSTETFCSD